MLVVYGGATACGSSSSAGDSPGGAGGAGVPDSGVDAGGMPDAPTDVPAPTTPYTKKLLDNVRISSDSKQPNFHTVKSDFSLDRRPFAQVTLVVDLATTCFPFETWKDNPPPKGQNWPADCDAFDRNFEMVLGDPAHPDAPALELVRAITPFGGPMHVEQDVTDVFNADRRAFDGPRTFQVTIPTYSDGAGKVTGSNGGWNVSARLEVTPGAPPRNVLAVIPLAYGSIGAKDTPKDLSFTLPEGTTSSRIEYRVTGHGGGNPSGDPACIGPADEFCKRTHHVLLDGAKLDDLAPWRNDCAKLCTVEKTARGMSYCKENPCGALGSVRAPRANWCPGSVTPPFTWEPDALRSPGKHSFRYAVDGVADGGSWRVSAVVLAYGG